MSSSKLFDNNYDFLCNYLAVMLGNNRGKGTVFLKNKTTSQVEVFKLPISEKGGLLSVKGMRLICWEDLAAGYTFVDGTSCRSRSRKAQ